MENSNRKAYVAPVLVTHGSIEQITAGAGSNTLADLFAGNFFDPLGTPTTPSTGS
jgi:hypothetical protein